jgi:proline dehydrogenase
MMRSLILKSSSLAPVQKLVREGKLFRPLVHRFIAGDTLDEALAASEELLRKGMTVTLDYLGENTSTEEEALQAAQTFSQMLDRIAERPGHRAIDPLGYKNGEVEDLNISIKLTQCGLDQGIEFAAENYSKVLETAKSQGNFVRVDMEASEYTERTIEMIETVYDRYPNTGTVLQSYLHRTDKDIDWAIGKQIRIRLVKGAYLEKPDVAYPEKATVDGQYVLQAKRLLEHGNYPAIATHDAEIITALNAFVNERNLDKRKFEYQMLYGIRRDLQESLVAEGYRVRIYVPFGNSWYPYFTRRLAERPANAFFILKNLFKG